MAEPGPSGGPVGYRTLVLDPRLVVVLLMSTTGTAGAYVGSPALPGIQSALAVPAAEIGLVMTAYFLPAVVMIPVVGVLADIYGRRRLVLAGLATFGVAGVAIAAVDSFAAVLVLRGLQGIGFAALTPFAITLIGDLYTGPAGSTAQGFRVSAHGIAQIVLPAAAGVLSDLAWNYPFLLYALAFPALVIAARSLPETGEPTGSPAGVVDEVASYGAAIRAEAADRALLVLVIGGFPVFFLMSGVLTFLPLLAVRSLGTSASVAGLVVAVLGAVRLVSPPLAGALLTRVSRRRALVATMALGVIGAAAMPIAPSVPLLGGCVLVYGVGVALAPPLLNDGVAARAADEHRGGIVSGLNVAKNLANMAAPAALGVLLALGGFRAVFWAAAGLALAYAVVVAVVMTAGDE